MGEAHFASHPFPMIEFHNVTVCYEPDKRHPVRSLDGLSLKIERGDWVFLVGPSGAGKSSLLKLLFADLRAQSGSITVDGEDISRILAPEIPRLRRKIGIVFQDYQLLSQKTAWENVAFALRVIGTPQSQIVREVPRALETVGLTHRAEAYPHQLSGGEQQRIAIARAIVNEPILLLADEPTGNLDPQTAREVGQLLTKINRERGTTIVMATHDGAFVDEIKRRVVRLKDGRVISDRNPGTYAELDEATRDHFFNSPTPPERTERVQVSLTPAPPAPAVAKAEPSISPEPIATPVSSPPQVKSHQAAPKFEKVAPKVPPIPLEPVSPRNEAVAALVDTPAPAIPAPIVPAPTVPAPAVPAPVIAVPVISTPPETPVIATPVATAPVAAAPVAAAPVVVAQVETLAQTPVVAPPAAPPIPIPPRRPPIVPPTPLANNDFEVDDFPPPRPMVRRLAPEEIAPDRPDHSKVASTAHASDPNAPLGSPENPIVQFE